MIDVHSHIIPGIDDGARDMEMALDMARQTAAAGVTHLVCTPHMHWGTFDNTIEMIEQGYQDLVAAVQAEGIRLELLWAGEIRINEMVPGLVQAGQTALFGAVQRQKSHVTGNAAQQYASGVRSAISLVTQRPVCSRWCHTLSVTGISGSVRKKSSGCAIRAACCR